MLNQLSGLWPAIWDFQTGLWIIGLALAYYWYRKSLRLPKPLYYSFAVSLFDEKAKNLFSELELHYAGKPVDSLKKTWLVVWNGGAGPLRPSDFAIADPLKIVCTDGNILRCAITKVTNPANNFALPDQEVETSSIHPTFEFFNPNDGVQIEVWHTGANSSVSVVGSVIGSGAITKSRSEEAKAIKLPDNPQSVTWPKFFLMAAFFAFLGWATYGGGMDSLLDKLESAASKDPEVGKTIDSAFSALGYLIAAIAAVFVILFMSAGAALAYQRVPKKLAISLNNIKN